MTITEDRRSRRVRDLLPPLLLGILVLSGAFANPALAHAERIDSNPVEGARLDRAPAELSIEFTEPPTGDANLVVMDGCDNDVVGKIQVQNMTVSASLSEGQPGRWTVRSTVVSGVDGHQTTDSWRFAVRGSKDCSAEPSPIDEASDEGDEDGSSFPVVPVLIGAVAVAAIALLLRVLTGRSSD